MSALSDYKATGDLADYESFKSECIRDEREYRDGLIVWDDEEDEENDDED